MITLLTGLRELLNALRWQWHLTWCPRDGKWDGEPRAWRCQTCRYRRFRVVS